MRAVHALLRARCPRQADCRIYLTEQRSWFYQRVRQQWPCVLGSEYHGDPLDPQGVLAFYDFGWDLLDVVCEAGFARAAWCLPWAPDEGLFWGLWALVARR